MAAQPVPSFAEIQKADQEEMKRNEKIRAKEIELQKQAAAKTNSQVRFLIKCNIWRIDPCHYVLVNEST